MSRLLSVREICERALRMIGAFPVTEAQADAEAMAEALAWFDLDMAELGGVERLFWLVPDTLAIDLAGGTKTYDLAALAAETGGVQFPISAELVNGTSRTALLFLDAQGYETIADPDRSGEPSHVYLDRAAQTLTIWPVPLSGVDTLDIRLVHQRFPDDYTAPTNGDQRHLAPASWQRMMIYTLAADLGNGPVRRHQPATVQGWRVEAERARAQLQNFENRLHADLPIASYADV